MARIRNIIPYRLARRRRLIGLSRRQVADIFGHKDTTIISRWERGITQPSLDNAFILGKLYHSPVEDIFHELSVECDKRLHQQKEKRKGRDP